MSRARTGKQRAAYSRGKGRNGEYAVRDAFRAAGFHAQRVPASGAAQGFKGDIWVRHTEWSKPLAVEVKLRAAMAPKLYEMLRITDNVYLGPGIWASHTLMDLFKSNHWGVDAENVLYRDTTKFKQWAQGLSILVVKADRKPYIYIAMDSVVTNNWYQEKI